MAAKPNILTNWKARRAGGRITITGVDGNGQPRKIVGVDEISSGKPPRATHKDGTVYELH